MILTKLSILVFYTCWMNFLSRSDSVIMRGFVRFIATGWAVYHNLLIVFFSAITFFLLHVCKEKNAILTKHFSTSIIRYLLGEITEAYW